MSYVNAETQKIEDTIRSGKRTMDEGQSYFSECISNAQKEVEKGEKDLDSLQESIAALEGAIEVRTAESKRLSDEIGNLRSEEIEAHRDGNDSSEISAQTMADYYERQRDALDAEIREMNKCKDELFTLKYEQSQKLDSDRKLLNGFISDKSEFVSKCEEIEDSNVRLQKQFDVINDK